MSNNENSWVALHFRYDGDLDRVLREVVSPWLIEHDNKNELDNWFFLRYWEAGPHIRLRVRGSLAETDSLDDLEGKYSRWVSGNNITKWNIDSFSIISEFLGKREPDANAKVFHPSGSFYRHPYIPEYHKYGEGNSLELFHTCFHYQSKESLSIISYENYSLRIGYVFCMAVILKSFSYLDKDFNELFKPKLVDRWRPSWKPYPKLQIRESNSVSSLLHSAESMGSRAEIEKFFRLAEPAIEWNAAMTNENLFLSIFALDNLVHLFCNRIGLSLDDEWYLRELCWKIRKEDQHA